MPSQYIRVNVPKQLFLFLLSTVAIVLIPRIDKALHPSSVRPGLVTLAGVGLAVIVFTGATFRFGLAAGFLLRIVRRAASRYYAPVPG